jgi:hypothetical protein
VVDIVVKAFGKAFVQSSSMLPYQGLQLGQWKLLLMKSGHHNKLVKEILAWLMFLGQLGSLDYVKLRKLPYLILRRLFL